MNYRNLAWMRLAALLHAPAHEGEGDDKGSKDDSDDTDEEPDDAPDQSADEWKRYAKRLRKENAKYRDRARTAEQKIKDAEANTAKLIKDAVAQAKAEADDSVKKVREETNARIIGTELRALATKEGMKDLDGLKMVDVSRITIGDDGEIKGATEVIANLKKSKAYLFGTADKSSSTEDPPPPSDDKPKSVKDLPKDEYEARKASMTGTRVPSRRG